MVLEALGLEKSRVYSEGILCNRYSSTFSSIPHLLQVLANPCYLLALPAN